MSTSRSIRRAAERRAKKLARKQDRLSSSADSLATESAAAIGMEEHPLALTPEPTPCEIATPEAAASLPPLTPVSSARLAANRANAKKSTGPATPEGKEKSSKNALKTALTGRTVLLPGDDADLYAERLEEYEKAYRPVGVREAEIVQLLADTWWRLERIPGLIEALYIKGGNELSEQLSNLDEQTRAALLRIEVYVRYERQFRNLEIQEARLLRQSEKLRSELTTLQKERQESEARDLANAAMLYLAARKDGRAYNPAVDGFEFSTQQLESYLYGARARRIAEQAVKQGEINPAVMKHAA